MVSSIFSFLNPSVAKPENEGVLRCWQEVPFSPTQRLFASMEGVHGDAEILASFQNHFHYLLPGSVFWSILRRWQQSPLADFHHRLGFQKRLQPRSLDFWIEWHRLAAFQVPCFGFCLVSRHQDQSSCALILFASSWVVRRALCQGSRRLQVGCSGQAIRCPVLRRIHPVLCGSLGGWTVGGVKYDEDWRSTVYIEVGQS